MKIKINRMTRQSGFTLIEVMVVVVILAILAAIVVPRIMSRPEQARTVKARTDIMAIENALEMYKLDNGFYPSTEQGVDALVHKPSGEPVPQSWQSGGYIKDAPIDPWGHAYHYAAPGKHGEVDIWTDGKGNGSTDDAIGNWNINKKS